MIRNAVLEDIPQMLALGVEMHAESMYAPFEFDHSKVADLMTALIQTNAGICIVAEVEGEILGGFIGSVYPHWFGNELQASDYALFIAKRHRQGSTAGRLIKEYIQQAKAQGAKQIMLANSTGYEPERVARLFEVFGFKRRGYVFELADV